MSDDVLSRFSLDQLAELHRDYEARQDSAGMARVEAAMQRAGAVQTPSLENCGKLFGRRVDLDPAALGLRPAVAYTGDPAAWMSIFTAPGVAGRFRGELTRGEHAARTLHDRIEK